MDQKKRAVLYVRVSTIGKDQKTDMQINDLKRMAEYKGFEITDVYEDVGVSGAISSRPALDQLMKDARERKFDAVLVWKFDRFARSVEFLSRTLTEFKNLGIDFLSFSENIDTSTHMGQFVYNILASVAQMERGILSERVKAGLREAKRQGKQLGTPPIPREPIIEMLKQGISSKEIQKKMKCSRWTVYRAQKELESEAS